jgi:putative ABC transport system permease protein
MTSLVQDLSHAIRSLRRAPGYLATALLTLGLGIGFSTATFSVINTVLLRPLPYPDPGRLLLLRERRLPQFPEFSVAPGHYLAWRDQSTVFEGMGSYGVQLANLDTGAGDPARVRADRVTANLFPLLGAAPLTGRAFTAADDTFGAPAVAILSYSTWQQRFGGRSDIVGQIVRLDREPVTIVGVMPADFKFLLDGSELWVPMAFTPREQKTYGSHYLSAVARMRPGVTADRARADLNTVAARVEQAHPEGGKGWDVLAIPLQDYYVRDVRAALLVLLGAVGLLLLIGCANVANLLLARGPSRQKELAIRSAIGASRWRLVRQLLVEQGLLALASAAAGMLAGGWLLRGLLAMIPDALPRQAEIGLDGRVLAFAVGLTVLTPILFGLFPAMQASRLDLRGLLAAGGRQSGPAAAGRARRLLVAAEMALAVMLLVGAALLIRSFERLSSVAPGFTPRGAIVASVSLPDSKYGPGEPRDRFFGELLARLGALPQVAAAGLTQSVPMVNDYVSSFSIEGEPVADDDRPTTNFYAVSPGYFEAMGIPLLRGRNFQPGDRAGATRVAIINQAFADRYFPGRDPIGRRIDVSQGPSAMREIIGIAGDVKQYGLGDRTTAQVYEPYLQHPYFTTFTMVIRSTQADATQVVPDVRAILRDLDRDVPLARVRTLDQIVTDSVSAERFSAVLIGIFSGAALLLAAIGVYGVVSYTVGLRRQEFAVRIAHGAGAGNIIALVLRGTLATAGIGVAAGLLGAWLLRSVLGRLLFGISPGDAATYAAAALLLGGLAILASAVPAWRASRVSPLRALRG